MFSYVGYDKSANECVDMLRNGELDIYTAAKKTSEREEEFAFSIHPAITATTCMNVKVGNTKVVAGDYSTYEGLRIGLLQRHTYNESFLAFAEEKGFDCEIIYYDTPTELSNALINDEVDALVNSYIHTPEDERVVEDFGQTPYYIMARKEDQPLIDKIDAAIDRMNVETPNWRSDLYNQYYGSQESYTELTEEEQVFLEQLQESQTVIRAVMDPDKKPYSWYEDGEGKGIAADIFRETAKQLGLDYEIVPVSTREEYLEVLKNGAVDIWMDMDSYYEDENIGTKYKITDPYLVTSVSVLRNRGAFGKIEKLAVVEDNMAMQEILSQTWPDAEAVTVADTKACIDEITSGNVNGAMMMTYMAQKIVHDDIQNRLSVEIVPGAFLDLQMGVNANDDSRFYCIWEKTLMNVSANISDEIVQTYILETATPTMIAYLYDHPQLFILLVTVLCLIAFLVLLYVQSVRSKNKQQKISAELAVALDEAKEANAAKQDFFSKMSHDIRTPLNVVLGMTQIAQKYKYDIPRLENALDSISTEGNYLLVLINSILDVNQLEHGHVELVEAPFNLKSNVENNIKILMSLAEKKEHQLTIEGECKECVVVGDANRFSQIVINIVSNAIKYTEIGGAIRVKLEMTEDDKYRFICSDNGIGMTQEFVQHICDDYARAEDSRVSKTQGTGLGMSVVKGLTDLMQGQLIVESELGVGSTFIVEIPFKKATKEQAEAVMHPASEDEAYGIRYMGRKVLLVEDNALNAEIATELLQTIGLEVVWEENGELGVKNFVQSDIGEYFAVFMDMKMPVMDGLEATKAIRNSGRADSDVPIFAMTANTFASDRKACQDAGMDGYIPKPIDIKSVKDTLEIVTHA